MPAVSTAHPGRAVPSLFSLTIFLAVGLAAAFVAGLLADAGRLWHRHGLKEAGEIPWVVFIKDGADPSSLEPVLRSLPGAAEVRFVSKDEALESARQDPALAEGLSLTGKNPFPASFVVRWTPSFLRDDLLESHSRRLAADPSVDHVDYDRARASRFALMQRTLHQGLLAMETAAAAGVGLLLLLAGRLLFFTPGVSAPWISASAASGLIGAGLGLLAGQAVGVPPSLSSFAAGAVVSGLLVLGRDAL
jgi:hypothetical protein